MPLPAGWPAIPVTPDSEYCVIQFLKTVPVLAAAPSTGVSRGLLYTGPGSISISTQLPAQWQGTCFLTVTDITSTDQFQEAPAVQSLLQFDAWGGMQKGAGAKPDFAIASLLARTVEAILCNVWGEPAYDRDGTYLGQVADALVTRKPHRLNPPTTPNGTVASLARFSLDALVTVIAPDNAAVSG
jgi:hypothetical protein